MMMRRTFSLLSAVAILLPSATLSRAADVPPAAQLPGEHSSITTQDGSIRDDELAKFIKDKIQAKPANERPKELKVFVQSCYGGGILDDLGGAMDMLGIPWVGGAASAGHEVSWGPGDPTTKGDYWTDELVKAIGAGGAGDKVSTDISTANANDPKHPDNTKNNNSETPQLASGSGGENITWDSASKHQVVLFAGKPDGQRHVNDLNNMKTALGDRLTGETIKSSQDEGRTTQDLKDMIMDAITAADNDTQLVLYFSDHGDSHFDVDEFLEANRLILPDQPVPVSPLDGGELQMPLGEAWRPSFDEALAQGELLFPELVLELDPQSPPMPLSEWELFFQGQQLLPPPLPGGLLQPGEQLVLPLDPLLFQLGVNQLSMFPVNPSPTALPLLFSNIELNNGGIATLVSPIPEPTAAALLVIALAGSVRRRR